MRKFQIQMKKDLTAEEIVLFDDWMKTFNQQASIHFQRRRRPLKDLNF